MNIGDRVRVIEDQDITGVIIALDGNKATIKDEDNFSGWESPTLECQLSELEKEKVFKFYFVQYFECEWESFSEEDAEDWCRQQFDLYEDWEVEKVEEV